MRLHSIVELRKGPARDFNYYSSVLAVPLANRSHKKGWHKAGLTLVDNCIQSGIVSSVSRPGRNEGSGDWLALFFDNVVDANTAGGEFHQDDGALFLGAELPRGGIGAGAISGE